MVLSSCGLVEKFKTPEQPTDSKDVTAANENSPDDLFSQTMDEQSEQNSDDNPSNISSSDSDLKDLQKEFAPMDVEKQEMQITAAPNPPDNSEESLPEITTQAATNTYSEEGEVKTYKVQKGETLMQIAFKVYGNIAKWKDIKNMNSKKFTSNTSLRAGTELKYLAPASPFVWNPEGTPYLIKTGETLGTISNTVYSTPKKWKDIWENNKPLITNPNVIFAGFTLYYANGAMANSAKRKTDNFNPIPTHNITEKETAVENAVEEILVDKKITNSQALDNSDESQFDEAIQTLSATKREQVAKAILKTTTAPKESELDLINNISIPHEQEIEPDIDEEIQTL